MITQEILVEIHVLHGQGHSIRKISRTLGLSRNTVRQYLRQPDKQPNYCERPQRPSKLDPFKDYLKERIAAAQPHWIPGTVLFTEVQAQGYTGGISIL
jgi:transposase